jgi:hypothetical protein
MKENPIFSGACKVEMQGERALHFLAFSQDHILYRLIGFVDPGVKVLDYRPANLSAGLRYLQVGKARGFAARFNQPALLTIRNADPGDIQIELHSTKELSPPHTLWIAIGIFDLVPDYDYLFRYMETLEDGRSAFLSIYRRKQPTVHKAFPYNFRDKADLRTVTLPRI